MALNFDMHPFLEAAVPQPRQLKPAERKKETLALSRFERIISLEDLQNHLTSLLASRRLKGTEEQNVREACDNVFGCDPWKYEPILLDQLFAERRGAADPEKINRLRGLIRAGSWMNYPRTTEKMALEDLAVVRRSETQDWHERIRHADPDTSKELAKNRDELLEELTEAEQALTKKTTGDGLDPAARTVEDLLGHEWFSMKQLIAANGLNWQAARTHHLTAARIQEIERLRALRDFIYYRLLYPTWAKGR
ncbi:MAG: hypothetical protein RDU25_04135 [Patescibacteria group bacterium]|nr:hypothetical protein [Patescibacteria group bacterium]